MSFLNSGNVRGAKRGGGARFAPKIGRRYAIVATELETED